MLGEMESALHDAGCSLEDARFWRWWCQLHNAENVIKVIELST